MYQNNNYMRGFVFKQNVRNLEDYIINKFGHDVIYSYGSVASFNATDGVTMDNGKDVPVCCVRMPKIRSLSNIDYKYFTEIVVDSFHENAHFQQLKFGRFSLDYVAYMNNKNLHDDNYRDNKREVAAEFDGVIGAYNYLAELYGEEKSENLLLNYVNERTASRNYWLKSDKLFSSLSEVSEAFEQRLAETMEVESNCCYKSRLKIGNRLPVEDEAALCMEPWKQEQSIWYPVYDSMNHSENMEVMERKFACLACYLHPEYFDRFPGLKKYDLKPEHVFGFPFPESAESVNKRIKECLHGSSSTRKTFTYKEQDFNNRQVITPDEWDDYYSEQCGGMEL